MRHRRPRTLPDRARPLSDPRLRGGPPASRGAGPGRGAPPRPWEDFCREESAWLDLGRSLGAAGAWADRPEPPELAPLDPPAELPPSAVADGSSSGSHGPESVSWVAFCREAEPWLRLGEHLTRRGAWAEVSWTVEAESAAGWTLAPSGSGRSPSPGAGAPGGAVDHAASGASTPEEA